MQFLPFASSTSTSAAAGFMADIGGNAQQFLGSGKKFLAALNEELAAAGLKPLDVVAGNGAPTRFRRLENKAESALNMDDIKALRDSLKKRGAGDKDLAAVDALIEAGGASSMGALMSTLLGTGRASETLDTDETEAVTTFLGKLGFDKEATESILARMERGGSLQTLKMIRERIEQLPEGELTDVDSKEFTALLRGLDLNSGTRDASLAAFGKDPRRSLSKSELTGLLAHAEVELNGRETAKLAIGQELRAAIDDVLRGKKQRENEAPQADARGSRKADRAEARMRDDLSAKSIGLGPEEMARRAREDAEEMHGTGTVLKAARNDASDEEFVQEEMGREADRRFADSQRAKSTGDDKSARNDAGNSGQAARSDDARAAMNAAFAKVGAEGMFSGAAQGGSAQQGALQGAQLPRAMQEEIFAQVQKGMLRELSNGSRQITLRLDPAELGQVTVLLTVNKGDVKALFRVENAEVGSALSEQMAQLRANLEEQGLRVSQLEVQTQLSEDPATRDWSGTDMYNREQEMREQARFQRLAKLRQEAGNELAQDMQIESIREEISPSGLHIVA